MQLKSVSGGGTEEKITLSLNYERGPWFNFYKKGNLVEVYETYDDKSYSKELPDNYLPKNYKRDKYFYIGPINSFDSTSSMLTIANNKELEISGIRRTPSIEFLEKHYGEMFVGKYFTN